MHLSYSQSSDQILGNDLPWLDLFCQSLGIQDKPSILRDLRDISQRINDESLSKPLFGLIADCISAIPDFGMAMTNLDRLLTAQPSLQSTVSQWLENPEKFQLFLKLLGTSIFISQILVTQYSSIEKSFDGSWNRDREALVREAVGLVQNCDSEKEVSDILRKFRLRSTLSIAAQDLFSHAPLEQTIAQISDLADACLEAALDWSIRRLAKKVGIPKSSDGKPIEIVAMALGKLGGSELNYSSDVDLLFIYSQEGSTSSHRPMTALEFYSRVISEFLRILAGGNSSTFILRVDLRLRPEGAQGPILMNLEQTMNYYDSVGRTWERQALIKVRPCAGSLELGQRFQLGIEPFVYRRYLNSVEIAEIQAMKRRIEHRSKQSGEAQWDVKTGFGGIRDIEFVVQFLQLLNGCSILELRQNETLKALKQLNELGCITNEEFEILNENYIFLRRIEHRLQLVDDRQTHRIPEQPAAQRILARMMQFHPQNSWESPSGPFERFLRDYRRRTEQNHELLNRLLHDTFRNETEEMSDPLTDLVLDPEMPEEQRFQAMNSLGFLNKTEAFLQLQYLAREDKPFFSTPRCRHFFSSLAPKLLNQVADTYSPDATLCQIEFISRQIPGKVALWEFLNQTPEALKSLVQIAAYQKLTTDLLTSRSNAWEDWSLFISNRKPFRSDHYQTEFQRRFQETGSLSSALRKTRDFAWLEIASQIQLPISQESTVETTRRIASVAQFCVDTMAQHLWQESIAKWHATTGSSELPGHWGIVAIGKLGGEDLLFHSDLDLIFLHDVNESLSSLKLKSEAENFFQVIAGKLIRLLGDTRGYFLYNVDTRLRPFGNSGPLSVSIQAFTDYYSGHQARFWERLALLRARSLFTQGFTTSSLNSLMYELSLKISISKTQAISELKELRQRTLNDIPSKRQDLKREAGGLHEAELLIQFLQWTSASKDKNEYSSGFWQTISLLQKAKVLSKSEMKQLASGYSMLRQVELALRIYRNRLTPTLEIQPEELPVLNRILKLPKDSAELSLPDCISEKMQIIHRIYQNHVTSDSA